jgi:hypothetical protein
MKLSVISILLFLNLSGLAQDYGTYEASNPDSYTHLADKRIKRELARYTTAGQLTAKDTSVRLKYAKEISSATDRAMFKRDSIIVVICSGNFVPKNYKLTYTDRFITKINGKFPYGVDGEKPTKIIKNIIVIIAKDTIKVPQSAFADLFEPTLYNTSVLISKDRKRIYICMSNSDGAGWYEVTFVIENKRYKQRILDNSF